MSFGYHLGYHPPPWMMVGERVMEEVFSKKRIKLLSRKKSLREQTTWVCVWGGIWNYKETLGTEETL